MWGRSASASGNGAKRFGPAKATGEARSENCGSKRTFSPESCTRNDECPIQVTVGFSLFARRKATSVATRGTCQPSGGGFGRPSRHCSHFHSQKLCGGGSG